MSERHVPIVPPLSVLWDALWGAETARTVIAAWWDYWWTRMRAKDE